MRTIAACLLAFFTMSCGDDDSMPTKPQVEPEPTPSVIGSWRNTGNNFSAKLTENYRKALVSQGLSQQEIERELQDDEFRWIFLENQKFIFRADNSGSWVWPGADGESTVQIKWSIQDSYLVLVEGSETVLRFGYTVTSIRLTLSMTVEDFVVFSSDDYNSAEEVENLSPEVRMELDALFQGITRIEFYFEKV